MSADPPLTAADAAAGSAGRGGLALLLAGAAAPAWPHAFGARHELPLPLLLFLFAAAGVVALSFLVAEWLPAPRQVARDRWPVLRLGVGGRYLAVVAQGLALGLLVLVVATGLLGAQSATGNFATVFTWIIWWVGLAFVQVLLGDVWALLNPWAALGRRVGALAARAGVIAPPLRYPARLGHWPAVALFLAVAWLELVAPAGERPRTLAWIVIGYSLYTWSGMALFGVAAWLRQADGVSVFFTLLGRFGAGRPSGDGGWALRPWAVGLLDEHPQPAGLLLFVLCMLASVSLDGFMETVAWTELLDRIVAGPLHGPLLALQARGVDVLVLLQGLALLGAPLLFLTVYLACCRLVAWTSGSGIGGWEVARRFALTLVPIAIGYHLAHYLAYLLLAGQLIIPRLSDPFGFGWDLFGTAGYTLQVTLMTAREAWYTALAAVVAGHVCAVWLAHGVALRLFATRRVVRRSQLPLLALMSGYTMLSLWILSQPLVEP
jgi:hypothetical protein